MQRSRAPYPKEFRQQMGELVRAGRLRTHASSARDSVAWYTSVVCALDIAVPYHAQRPEQQHDIIAESGHWTEPCTKAVHWLNTKK